METSDLLSDFLVVEIIVIARLEEKGKQRVVHLLYPYHREGIDQSQITLCVCEFANSCGFSISIYQSDLLLVYTFYRIVLLN